MAEETIKAKANKEEKATKTEKKKFSKGAIIGCIAGAVVLIAIIVALIIINPFKRASMIGKYDLTGMTSNGEDQSSMIEALKAFGVTAELEITDDRNGKINIFGDSSDFTYDNKQFHFEFKSDEEDDDEEIDISMKDADYSFKDDKITIKTTENNGSGEMIFTKKK